METNNFNQTQTTANQQQSGLGIAGMIIGIISLLLSCIVVGGFLGIIGLILSIVGITQKNKKGGTSVAGIVLNSIAIFIMIIILTAFGSGEDDTSKNVNSSTETNVVKEEISKESTNDNSEPNTEVSSKIETENNVKEDIYHVGDTWENKYVLVSFDECGEYESDNQFVQPSDGNKYIYATFTFENIGKSDTTVGNWDFDCYADGYSCDSMYFADDAGFSQTLSSGRKIKGSVYFEVPDDAKNIEIEYSPNFWTSEKVIFVFE